MLYKKMQPLFLFNRLHFNILHFVRKDDRKRYYRFFSFQTYHFVLKIFGLTMTDTKAQSCHTL